jgi:xanthine dehydrogenase molybdopterin-binding subunit B
VVNYKKIPILDAPATPENILMSIKEIKNRKMNGLYGE